MQYHFFDGYPGSFVTPGGQTLYGFDEYNNFDQLKDTRAAFMNATFANIDRQPTGGNPVYER